MKTKLNTNEMYSSNIIAYGDNMQQISILEEERRKIYLFFKRLVDVVLSSLGIVLLSPIFIMIAILVRIDSEGKAIYKHKRIGKNGKYIYLYKFRSMYKNSDEIKANFTPEQVKEYKENFKLKDDPRVTKIGKIIRKTSLDELPQLFNILKGDMSIIGPRPIIDEELEKYSDNKEKFLSVTPGLTGNWAANGRSDITYEQRMIAELFYIDNMCITFDVKIFVKTIISVLRKEGAL